MFNFTSTVVDFEQNSEKSSFVIEDVKIHECRENPITLQLSNNDAGYIIYSMNGSGELSASACYPLAPGEICLFVPGKNSGPAWFKCLPHSKFCVISFKIIAAKNNCHLLHIAPSIHQSEGNIASYVEMILKETHLQESNWQYICNYIIDILYTKVRRTEAPNKEQSGKIYDQLPAQMIRSYVDNNYTQKITIASIARALFVSESTVSHSFSTAYNLTVTKYILLKRIQESKRYLTDTDLPISEIAQKVGFSSLTTYYRNFKQITGIAPGDYREQLNS